MMLCHSNLYKEFCQSDVSCTFSAMVGTISPTSHGQVDILSFDTVSASASHDGVVIPSFACSDDRVRFAFSQVCNALVDCEDGSDESFCGHSPCVRQFRCSSGQCVPYTNTCDHTAHCHDESDETDCVALRLLISDLTQGFYSTALITFSSKIMFTLTPMKPNESCPDSHYRCPGEYDDCLPVFTRCDRNDDCLYNDDEKDCKNMTCPGFLRCRDSRVCVHADNLCDGWSQCPLHDDELLCEAACPVHCQCEGDTFLCARPFNAATFLQLRYLDATESGMTMSDISNNTYLIHLVLARCSLTHIPHLALGNLQVLDLSGNQLEIVNLDSVFNLENLKKLLLSSNPLTAVFLNRSSTGQHAHLIALDLSYSTLTVLDADVLSPFPGIRTLNLTRTDLHTLPSSLQSLPQLADLLMEGSPLTAFPVDILSGLWRLRSVRSDNYRLCCHQILPDGFDERKCHAPGDALSSCDDLIHSWAYRAFLWLVACLALTGNMVCFSARLLVRRMSWAGGFGVFVLHLTAADCLMGVYVTVIGVTDERLRHRYLHYDQLWKTSGLCRAAGCLSLLSSEVSALIICLITLDRFVVLRFPFSTVRFQRTSASLAVLLVWLTGVVLGVVPLLPVTSHWEFYGQTGICIPLPVTREHFKGRYYSLGVLIFLNFALFLLISAGQLFIYRSVQKNAMKMGSTRNARDVTLARRLITVAVTDFLCWFPIGLCGILALCGVAISGEVNVALAVFVLPLNSAINPFLYTFNTLAEKRRNANEAKLTEWLERRVIVNDIQIDGYN